MRGPCWTLNHATEGIGGGYPQHQEMGRGYDYRAPGSVHRLSHDALPDFEPNFRTVIIHGQAKLTDLVSSAPIANTGFLVSARMQAVLEKFVMPVHRFYPVPDTQRGKTVEGYAWLHLPQPRLPLSESTSTEEAEQIIASIPELASLDLLRLYTPARFAYCFVSDPLRSAMESAKLTGVRFGRSKLFR